MGRGAAAHSVTLLPQVTLLHAPLPAAARADA